MVNIQLKRVYEAPSEDDGMRILVDRMWPRGIKKSDLQYDLWGKDLTPSTELRRFFHEAPDANWDTFSQKYLEELMHNEALDNLANIIKQSGVPTVTLLYGFRNPVRNHAVILRNALLMKISEK